MQMIESFAIAASTVFQYSAEPLRRRHCPRGYASYKSYKPWLRDEFDFRCVYCLCRERWEPNGQDVFSVEHIQPQATSPELATDYDNLIYACLVCNAYRRDEPLLLNPDTEAVATHLQILRNGTAEASTIAGEQLIDVCHLNRPSWIDFRNYVLDLMDLLLQRQSQDAERILQRLLCFPHNLPNLKAKRPPAGNGRPDSLSTSYFEPRKRGKLPEVY